MLELFAPIYTNLSATSSALIAAWDQFRALPGSDGLTYNARTKALRSYLKTQGLLTLPGTHQEVLEALRALSGDMLKAEAHGDGDIPPLRIYRDALVMALTSPARSMADVRAKLAFSQETEHSLVWGYLDDQELRAFVRTIAQDLDRLAA